ncbi:hypothetical protein F4774DRAFT_390235 [Daldinia eschscholtzii]|nr:hypothetical protein F4774DRAFT_390235 [Daldinia eschscholtzii]
MMDKNNLAPSHLQSGQSGQSGVAHHILGDQVRGPLQETRKSLENIIQGGFANIRKDATELRRDRLASNYRHTKFKNTLTRGINRHDFHFNSGCALLPLQSLVTEQVIRNCPRSVAAIMKLPAAEAGRILGDLRVPEPAGPVGELRRAVLKQFIGISPIGF